MDSQAIDSSTYHPERKRAVRIRNLVKRYVLGGGIDLSLKSKVMAKLKGQKPDILTVLNGLDLDLYGGEAVGICGANGAGKSTLLKIIAGIIPPTSGEVEVEGRVASLLELGAGFHPEMTGEENVLLNGVLLGISEKDLRKKMSGVFRAAGLERFRSTPVKHYSSGMVQRLAFSIASNLDPDIMILDEIFAVGDIVFQRVASEFFYRFKALNKTIVLVSHDLSILERFCDRVIMIADGRVLLDGPSKMVTHQYAILYWQSNEQIGTPEEERYFLTNRGGDQRMRLAQLELLNEKGEKGTIVRQGSAMTIRVAMESHDEDLSHPVVSVRIQDDWGEVISSLIYVPPDERTESCPESFHYDLVFDELLLNPGHYSLQVTLQTRGGWILDSHTFAESFIVLPREESEEYEVYLGGVFSHPCHWVTGI
ncbi:MAG: ABC transporter ATP-binding protein [Candidatus Omnitrophica bacterium]|nr:ABC transporter ATP-binding protein [Candidatus Omnitrophota bacterium]MCA9434592.1 ABC transporter ATP-binding protein [Candidatus Omnitrophota bacterium]MCA9447337.1 ABC transporter ATP-binding protein [Candidatus Omnitrophota bacterium]